MKILSKEEQEGQQRATMIGGAKGFVTGLGLSLAGSYILNKRWANYRALPLSLKALGVVIIAVPSFVIPAERASLRFEKEQWTGVGKEELDTLAARKEARWNSMTLRQKIGDVAARHQFGLIGGTWAIAVAGSFGWIMRNRYQTYRKKSCRLHVRNSEQDEHGLRHLPADHSWKDILEQEKKDAAADLASGKVKPIELQALCSSPTAHSAAVVPVTTVSMARGIIRTVSLACSFVGALINLACAIRLLALWRSLGWEIESEWEGSADVWMVDSVKMVWGLLSAYFAAAAASCFIGFVGIAKNVGQFVRIYRDYSIADFAFVTLSTLFVSYTSFSSAYVRTSVCEELSRHPELMRDLGEMGLSLENCEQWFERAVVAMLGIMFILIVVRLHIVIALSQYYNHIYRDYTGVGKLHLGLRPVKTDSLQRIYLLPTPTSPSTTSSQPLAWQKDSDDVAVYATVPLGGLSEEDVRNMHATEAWIPSPAASPRTHRHSHSHSSSHSHSHRHHGWRRASIPLVREDERSLAGDEKAEFGVAYVVSPPVMLPAPSQYLYLTYTYGAVAWGDVR
ncbi:hypothetical protein A0H81_09858 [Grifola frondosa]|uniref:Uncharacterized protein n=1 Tax=Grifola frondosa TaxID=5627 RepID=A0A1C7M4U0_GRIFR|nr:hypothetical protein A0H81_09858 [Grifola frondosa]